MKVSSRTRVGLLFALVLLVATAILFRNSWHKPSRANEVEAKLNFTETPELIGVRDTSVPRLNAVPDTEDLREIRGAGYNWGAALKAVYSEAKITSDNKLQLNVTALIKSFKGISSPVDLEDSSSPGKKRAEYLAATITAALDLDASHHRPLVEILEGFYSIDRDKRLSQLEKEQSEQERIALCTEARGALANGLPPTMLEHFSNLFGSPKFLFETRSVAAGAIEFDQAESSLLAKGNAVFGIGNNGAMFFNADESTMTQKPQLTKSPSANPSLPRLRAQGDRTHSR